MSGNQASKWFFFFYLGVGTEQPCQRAGFPSSYRLLSSMKIAQDFPRCTHAHTRTHTFAHSHTYAYFHCFCCILLGSSTTLRR